MRFSFSRDLPAKCEKSGARRSHPRRVLMRRLGRERRYVAVAERQRLPRVSAGFRHEVRPACGCRMPIGRATCSVGASAGTPAWISAEILNKSTFSGRLIRLWCDRFRGRARAGIPKVVRIRRRREQAGVNDKPTKYERNCRTSRCVCCEQVTAATDSHARA